MLRCAGFSSPYAVVRFYKLPVSYCGFCIKSITYVGLKENNFNSVLGVKMNLKNITMVAGLLFSVSSFASDIQKMPTLFDCKMSKDVGSVLFGSWGSSSYD